MAGRLSAQWGDEPDDTEAWMAWRNAGLAQQPEADALGRDLWNGATRSGDNLWGAQPGDLTALGLAALQNRIEPGIGDQVEGRAPDSEAPNDHGVAGDRAGAEAPSYKTVAARPGDSISRLMGTSRPDAIGRFVSLNSLKNSSLRVGQSYRVPTSYGDATPDESAIGNRLLRSDNARLAAAARVQAANQARNDLFAQRLNAGRNVWTGEAPGNAPPPSGRTTPPGAPNLLDQATKVAGGTAAYAVGTLVGVPVAAYHAVGDVKDLGEFGFEAIGAFGPKAKATARRGFTDKTHSMLQYGRAVMDDPSRLVSDVGDLSKATIDSVNPFDAPMSGTFQDVVGHEFGKGENLGEAAANVAGTLAGGETVAGLVAAGTFDATRAANVAKFINQGFNPRLAEYLAERYPGLGHHSGLPRRKKIPDSVLGIPVDERWAGKPYPGWISDSPLNLSNPPGMSRGDFYQHHYRTDPRYHGGSLPRDLNDGKGWSGKKLGLRRYNPIQRTWYGTPVPLKGAMAGVSLGEGLGLFEAPRDGVPQ